jgi:DHA1 family multidrug resistance protein-like MFS transporter
MLWSSGPVWVAFFFLVPETYSDTILLRRAVRLRRLTGNKQLKSQSEVKQGSMTLHQMLVESLLRPMQIMILDPAITYTAIYTSLVYGIYYSFFEAFPLVYPVIYGFSLGEMGLVFLSVLIGVIISLAIYCFYILAIWVPTLKSKGPITPEMCLIPALYACFIPPIGLFIFGTLSPVVLLHESVAALATPK